MISRLKMWAAAVLVALAGLVSLWAHGRRAGAQAEQHKGMRDAAERTEKGRRAVQRGRDSGADPAGRLRGNDDRWR
jgi:membrane protein implicated in regulation of membrane protease activity